MNKKYIGTSTNTHLTHKGKKRLRNKRANEEKYWASQNGSVKTRKVTQQDNQQATS